MGSMFALFTWFWIMNLDVNADLQRVSISFLDESIQVRAMAQSMQRVCDLNQPARVRGFSA